MPVTNASTALPGDVLADPRPGLRALTIESAEAWLNTPMPAVTHLLGYTQVRRLHDQLAEARVAVRHLIHELQAATATPPVYQVAGDQAAVNAAGIAQARGQIGQVHRLVCGGSNQFVRGDDVSGDGIITCPDCGRRQTTSVHPEPLMAGRRTIDAHPARHLARCRDDDGKLECVCGLADAAALATDAEGRCL